MDAGIPQRHPASIAPPLTCFLDCQRRLQSRPSCHSLVKMLEPKHDDTRRPAWGYTAQSHPVRATQPVPYDTQLGTALAAERSYAPAIPPSQSLHVPPPPLQTRALSRDDADGSFTTSPSALTPINTSTAVKRSYAESTNPYLDVGYDQRAFPEISQPTVQSNDLLSFRDTRTSPAIPVTDQHGQVRRIEINAQISGMFFLSELSPRPEDEASAPELTCYRRNLFQVAGSVYAPRGSLFIASDRRRIRGLEISIKATESVDKRPVEIIVIPWRTTPANSPELCASADNKPIPVQLQPFGSQRRVAEGSNDHVIYPVTYRRLQFRAATGNNGRRRELQQHFLLHLTLVATLEDGEKIEIHEVTTNPMVVRGRSPRNFANKQGFPVPGTSASRGLGIDQHAGARNGIGTPAMSSKLTSPTETHGSFSSAYDGSQLPEPLSLRQM